MFKKEGRASLLMKNKFITKYLCVTLAAAMLISNSAFVLAEEDFVLIEDSIAAEPQIEETIPEIVQPEPVAPEIPEPAPEVPEAEPVVPENPPEEENQEPQPENPGEIPSGEETPGDEEHESGDLSEEPSEEGEETTENPENPDVTATPTPTPEPGKPEKWIKEFIEQIKKLFELEKITIEQEPEILKIREEYDKLSEEDKKKITNYKDFEEVEKRLKEEKDRLEQIRLAESYPTNLHVGSPFDISTLSARYRLGFSGDFAAVMSQIEREYLASLGIQGGSDGSSVTSNSDKFLVRNWQDVLAVYLLGQHKNGKNYYQMDASSKTELAEAFAEMNPILTDKYDAGKQAYANYHIDRYIEKHQLSEEDQAFLRKYLESGCKLLCASATASRGFIRQSIGEYAAEERVNMLAAAYSLVGKVSYFWGGKSSVIGWDSRWGTPTKVECEGSRTTGTYRLYGLDCSGFVTWTAINAFQNYGMEGAIGVGTSSQWGSCIAIDESEAQPGDLVFQRGPEAGSNNHVGIICGKTESGDWIAVHCNASYNGVTVDEAYGAGFRYIRRPAFYPSADQVSWLIHANMVDPVEETEQNTQEPQTEAVEDHADEYDYTVEIPEQAEEITLSPDDIVWIYPYDFDFEFEIKTEAQQDMSSNHTLVSVDSDSEFFVGPLKPEVIPLFGPEQMEEAEVFGPELPPEICIEVNDQMLAEEYEVKA